ncbi:MAG: 7-cyano-7-deazaguanine synthase, partial [Nitrospina sp.]|nr:7-cyano-7-deazaguanine synthase [Nitrospina sp.]
MTPKAIVLLSGGLDSTTTLAIAKNAGYDLYTISFNYGQRHKVEIEKAKIIAEHLGVKEHRIVNMDLAQFGNSALTDSIDVPTHRNEEEMSSS